MQSHYLRALAVLLGSLFLTNTTRAQADTGGWQLQRIEQLANETSKLATQLALDAYASRLNQEAVRPAVKELVDVIATADQLTQESHHLLQLSVGGLPTDQLIRLSIDLTSQLQNLQKAAEFTWEIGGEPEKRFADDLSLTIDWMQDACVDRICITLTAHGKTCDAQPNKSRP